VTPDIQALTNLAKALLEARESGSDPYDAIENVTSWKEIESAISEVTQFTSSSDESFKSIEKKYATFNRYMPRLLKTVTIRGISECNDIIEALKIIVTYHDMITRSVPEDVPLSFFKKH
jgi:hypothetical protein